MRERAPRSLTPSQCLCEGSLPGGPSLAINALGEDPFVIFYSVFESLLQSDDLGCSWAISCSPSIRFNRHRLTSLFEPWEDVTALEKVWLIPDPRGRSQEELRTRWELVKLAAAQDSRLQVPTWGRDAKLSADIDAGFKALKKDHRPSDGRWKQVVDTVRADQTTRFHKNAAMNEGLLPRRVALRVRADGLYGHTGERGYYGLPLALTTQIDYEQRLNDRIEDV